MFSIVSWKNKTISTIKCDIALINELAQQGILIRTRSMRGAAEEAPGAYKDVDLVAQATEQAGLARRVAFLRPKVCVKG